MGPGLEFPNIDKTVRGTVSTRLVFLGQKKLIGTLSGACEEFLVSLKGLYQCETIKKLIFFWLIRQFALLRIFCENFKVVSLIFFEWQSFKEEPLASVKSIGKSLNAFFSK